MTSSIALPHSARRATAAPTLLAKLVLALLAFVALVLCAPKPARALDDAATAGIRATIEGQLEAFRRDDAATAYGYAAPSIQQVFPSQDVFMQMVRQGYAPVYRPRSYAFERLREFDGRIGQEVRIIDAEGGNWIALYAMEQQPDGSWKISGCRLLKAPENNV